jgi:hypothetical protein
MRAKWNGVTVEIVDTVTYKAPSAAFDRHRTVAKTKDGVVVLECISTGEAAGIPTFLDKLTDFSE